MIALYAPYTYGYWIGLEKTSILTVFKGLVDLNVTVKIIGHTN